MRRLSRSGALALAFPLLAAPVASAAPLSPAAAEVAGLLPGTYVSRDAAASVRFEIASVPKSRIGDGADVFYVEAARTARPGAPFLQRFLRLADGGDGRVALRVYEPRDLAGVRGKWRDPDALALFTERDVRERPDCRITLAKAPAGHWAGGTAAATCFSAAAGARLAVTVLLSPQTLEWREAGTDAAGRSVHGPAGEIAVYGREAPGAAPALDEAAPAPAAAPAATAAPRALAAPVAGGVGREGGPSSKVNEPAAEAPAALEVIGPSSPSKKYDLAALRAIAEGGEGGRVALSRLVPAPEAPTATVVVVTSRSGAVSVFSFAEISSSDSPSLDLTGPAPRLVAAPGRGLSDVVSIEVREMSSAK